MAESVIVRQNRDYELEVLATDPHDPESTEFAPVELIYQMTPYTMLLVSVAACTAIVVNTYAEYHAVPLEAVELHATYDRIFQEDCEQCEALDEFEEMIDMHIAFSGELTPADRHKLFAISKHCPIEKMMIQGIQVRSHLVDQAAPE